MTRLWDSYGIAPAGARGGHRAPPGAVAHILSVVAECHALTVADLRSDRRDARVVRARHLAVWLARRLTSHTTTVIGHALGDRDHSTVCYSLRRMDDRFAHDPALHAEAMELAEQLERELARRGDVGRAAAEAQRAAIDAIEARAAAVFATITDAARHDPIRALARLEKLAAEINRDGERDG